MPYEEKCFIPVDSCSCSSWSLSKCLADSSRHWRGRLLLASSGYNSFLDLSGQTVCTQMENGSAVLIAHAVGFCSLLVTLWQFLLETDETRNMTLAVFSQMFSVSTPLYLFGGIARLFESQPNYAGRASMVALQVIALIYMMIVFCIGIYLEKRKNLGYDTMTKNLPDQRL